MRSLWLLSMLCAMAIGALVSAQTLRIPLQRRDLPSQPNAAQTQTHPFRSLSDLSRQLASTPSHHSSHPTLNLAVNPASVVPLRNYYNRMYTGKVSVGTPANEYSLVFDTGSADMSVCKHWLHTQSTPSPVAEPRLKPKRLLTLVRLFSAPVLCVAGGCSPLPLQRPNSIT